MLVKKKRNLERKEEEDEMERIMKGSEEDRV